MLRELFQEHTHKCVPRAFSYKSAGMGDDGDDLAWAK